MSQFPLHIVSNFPNIPVLFIQVIVIDKGTISEFGTHDELIAKKGVYKKLVLRQLMAGGGGEEKQPDGKEEGVKDLLGNSSQESEGVGDSNKNGLVEGGEAIVENGQDDQLINLD